MSECSQIVNILPVCSAQIFKWTADIESRLIQRAMENVERGTCVKFVPRTHQQDFIDILPKSGWVPLHVKFNSLQQLSIKLKCDSYGAQLMLNKETSGRNSLQIYKSNVNK